MVAFGPGVLSSLVPDWRSCERKSPCPASLSFHGAAYRRRHSSASASASAPSPRSSTHAFLCYTSWELACASFSSHISSGGSSRPLMLPARLEHRKALSCTSYCRRCRLQWRILRWGNPVLGPLLLHPRMWSLPCTL